MTKKTNIRFDADGRKCTCGARKPLAAPRPLTLRDVAEAIHVHRSQTTMTPEQRAAMEAEIARIDGDALPAGKHIGVVAGVYLGALAREARHGAHVKADTKPPTTTVQPTSSKPTAPVQSKPTAKEREDSARKAMRKASTEAWNRRTK